MPDTLNKQTLINLLIDSPLREPIKINLIDIVNNTSEPDLPKVYPTIVKELEIFQKATERRMKLADETITKLGGTSPASDTVTPTAPPDPSVPPIDLPPLPTPQPPSPTPTPTIETTPTPPPAEPAMPPTAPAPLSVPPLDLPPLPTVSAPEPAAEPAPAPVTPNPLPSPEPMGGPANSQSTDEAALAEIQKELESLKAGVTADAAQTTPPPTPTQG